MLTLTEVSDLTRVTEETLRAGVESGVFDGLCRRGPGKPRFVADVSQLVVWSKRLNEDIQSGAITLQEGVELLHGRAEQVRQRLRLERRGR